MHDKYEDILSDLFNSLPMYQRVGKSAFKKNLDNIYALCDHLDQPQNKFKSIHIAGTNGKGTTAHILSAFFQANGKKVGLYTSPHYKDFRERIKINGLPIQKQFVIDFVETNKSAYQKINASFFEITVAMAFDVFAKEKVDIAIIETGLGGRLDSTNVIIPELSVITNISLDHTNMLGETLPEIACEKAGIIKKEVPVIIGERQSQVEAVFVKKAKQENADLTYAADNFKIEIHDTRLDHYIADVHYEGRLLWQKIKIDLKGDFLLKNVCTALETARIWNKKQKSMPSTPNPNLHLIAEKGILNALSNLRSLTNYIGRWHILNKSPLAIGDSAHNRAGLKAFIESAIIHPHTKLHIIFGMVNDKDPLLVFDLLPKDAVYYFTEANIPRTMRVEGFKEITQKSGHDAKFFTQVKLAYEEALKEADSNDLILVCGSIFVLAELL